MKRGSFLADVIVRIARKQWVSGQSSDRQCVFINLPQQNYAAKWTIISDVFWQVEV
jgi:hypothetical protein